MLSVDATVIVVFIIIWLLLAVLTKIFFNPVRKVMSDRDSEIQGNLEVVSKATAEYEQTLQNIEAEVKQARSGAIAIQHQFEQEALQEKERMLTEISQECRARIDEARSELERQVEGLEAELKAQSGLLAEKIERRLLN